MKNFLLGCDDQIHFVASSHTDFLMQIFFAFKWIGSVLSDANWCETFHEFDSIPVYVFLLLIEIKKFCLAQSFDNVYGFYINIFNGTIDLFFQFFKLFEILLFILWYEGSSFDAEEIMNQTKCLFKDIHSMIILIIINRIQWFNFMGTQIINYGQHR